MKAKILILIALISFHLAYFYPLKFAYEIVFLLLLLSSNFNPLKKTTHLCLLFFIMAIYHYLPLSLVNAPVIHFVTPILLSWIFLKLSRAKERIQTVRLGTIDLQSTVAVVGVGIAATAALIFWARATDNLGAGLGQIKQLSELPPWVVLGFVIPVFALSNAVVEEWIFRGIIYETVKKTFSNMAVVLLIQSCFFAAVHYAAGFPNGIVGYAMVVIYGLALGYLKEKTNGLLAPVLSHIIADLTIGYYLYSQLS